MSMDIFRTLADSHRILCEWCEWCQTQLLFRREKTWHWPSMSEVSWSSRQRRDVTQPWCSNWEVSTKVFKLVRGPRGPLWQDSRNSTRNFLRTSRNPGGNMPSGVQTVRLQFPAAMSIVQPICLRAALDNFTKALHSQVVSQLRSAKFSLWKSLHQDHVDERAIVGGPKHIMFSLHFAMYPTCCSNLQWTFSRQPSIMFKLGDDSSFILQRETQQKKPNVRDTHQMLKYRPVLLACVMVMLHVINLPCSKFILICRPFSAYKVIQSGSPFGKPVLQNSNHWIQSERGNWLSLLHFLKFSKW